MKQQVKNRQHERCIHSSLTPGCSSHAHGDMSILCTPKLYMVTVCLCHVTVTKAMLLGSTVQPSRGPWERGGVQDDWMLWIYMLILMLVHDCHPWQFKIELLGGSSTSATINSVIRSYKRYTHDIQTPFTTVVQSFPHDRTQFTDQNPWVYTTNMCCSQFKITGMQPTENIQQELLSYSKEPKLPWQCVKLTSQGIV